MSAYARISEYLHRVPEIPLHGGRPLDHSLGGRIEFDRVWFAYPSRPHHPVFEGFDLTIPKGQVLALCGTSGAGKSTVGAVFDQRSIVSISFSIFS
jgi:ABC-type multidrug transport system fused ATPase/permease subunit